MHIRLSQEVTFHTLESPLLICLPGAGFSPAIYDHLQFPGWSVVGLDWSRGDRPIDPDAVARRLARAIGDRAWPTALAGHSAGAAIAALTAALFPERIDCLVISNTGVHSRNHGDPDFLKRVEDDWSIEQQDGFLLSCFKEPPQQQLFQELRNYLATLPVETLAESIAGLRALDLADWLPAIRAKTLVAHGHFDTRRSVADAQGLASAIQGAALKLLPGGHTPMVECSLEYSKAVAELLDSAPIAVSENN